MSSTFESNLPVNHPLSETSNSAPQFLVGLDLVFSGASGYCIFDFVTNQLLECDLLDTGDRGSSQVAEKIKRGKSLFNKLAHIAIHFPKAYWIIETTDWINKAMPQRERETLKSLALARGIAFAAALIYQTALPFTMGVNEVRDQVMRHQTSKRAQFEYIRLQYQLHSLADSEANMNITDAIALSEAFKRLLQLPSNSPHYKQFIDYRLSKAAQAYRNHQSAVADQLGSRKALHSLPAPGTLNFDLASLKLDNHLTQAYRIDLRPQGERWAAIDISSANPGCVVYDRRENDHPSVVFHHTFSLDRPQPDRKKAKTAYEIAVASNILRAIAILKSIFNIHGIVFEYSDWHRSGKGLEFQKDRSSIDSLFFSYGNLLASAYQYNLELVGVNALDAKNSLTGNKNAKKVDVKSITDQTYPFLRNEHTRDAAGLMLVVHGKKA